MKQLLKYTLAICILSGIQQLRAQGPGSVESIGGTIGAFAYGMTSGNTTASAAETLYIGPGNYQIDGTWEIYSKYVWISPDAVITGTGIIQFFNPSVAGGVAGAIQVDGNNNAAFVNINLELHNADNMVLTDMAGPGGGWVDVTANANLTISKDFKFSVTNGDILLGNYDMVTDAAATLSNYLPSQFVVTNGTGHLVHNNYTGAFIYPVGIAEGDYTPASVDNTITNTLHVSVQNYATSTAAEAGDNGIDRTWNIYADNAVANSIVTLQHNVSTNQASYDDATVFVTRYSAAAPNTTGETALSQSAWQSNNLAAGSGAGSLTTGVPIASASERSLTYTTFATSASNATSFFSKSSNQFIPLPVKLISFDGRVVNCTAALKWVTAEELNADYFELQKSAPGYAFQPVGRIVPEGSNSTYTFTDENTETGSVSYRLRIVDTDGKERYSKTITLSVHCDGEPIIKVYPNPIDDILTISGIIPNTQLRLMNGVGQAVVDIMSTGAKQEIDMRGFKPGSYWLHIVHNNIVIKSIKLIKR